MALTRKFLSALGIEDAKADEIIEVHSTTVTNIKSELEKYKEKAENLEKSEEKLKDFEKLQKEVEKLKETVKIKEDETQDYKSKYEKTQKEYDDYKESIKNKEIKDTKSNAFKGLLKEAKIPEKRFDAIVKLSDDDIDKIEFEEDGSIKNKDDIIKSISDNWSEYVRDTQTRGANTSTPPANNGGEDKKISRAKQIAQQYHDDLYGKLKED